MPTLIRCKGRAERAPACGLPLPTGAKPPDYARKNSRVATKHKRSLGSVYRRILTIFGVRLMTEVYKTFRIVLAKTAYPSGF